MQSQLNANYSYALIDSGLGGIEILNDLASKYPNLYYYFGDFKYLPYGNKSYNFLKKRLIKIMQVIIKLKIKTVIIACNTICANFKQYLEENYPMIKFISIIELTCSRIKNQSNIVVVATTNTVNSHQYLTHLSNNQNHNIVEVACQEWVMAIENQTFNQELVFKSLNNYLEFSHLVLACTHFTLGRKEIESVFKAQIYDSLNLIKLPVYRHKSKIIFYTSDTKNKLQKKLFNLYRKKIKYQNIYRF